MQLCERHYPDHQTLGKRVNRAPFFTGSNRPGSLAINITRFNSISHIICQFDTLARALIDTSSVIYLHKINLLDIAARTLQLSTVPGVVDEFGSLSVFENIDVVELKEIITAKRETDDHLIKTAAILDLPVISEDRKILMQAKKIGLPYFNTLMIMNLLIYKNKIDEGQYRSALDILQNDAYYDAFIFEYGKLVMK